MSDSVARGRSAIQRLIAEGQTSALRALDQYVANRRRTFSLFERLDPHSQQTRDAMALLEKAIEQRDAYAALIAEPRVSQPRPEL